MYINHKCHVFIQYCTHTVYSQIKSRSLLFWFLENVVQWQSNTMTSVSDNHTFVPFDSNLAEGTSKCQGSWIFIKGKTCHILNTHVYVMYNCGESGQPRTQVLKEQLSVPILYSILDKLFLSFDEAKEYIHRRANF